MVKRNNSILFLFIVALSSLVLFTYLQNYYSVIIHVILMIGCMLSARTIDNKVYSIIFLGILGAVLTALIAIDRSRVTPVGQFGFFLHFLTWPCILLISTQDLTRQQKFSLLRIIIIICIVSNILSLKALMENAELSRQLAGAATEGERYLYQSMGVGGYGYVYAMVFLTYGAIVWYKNTKSIFEKLLLMCYLITNYLFILYASYTLAIIFVLAMTVAALTTKMEFNKANVILFVFLVFILIFGKFIIQFFIDLSKDLELTWVYDRMSKLLDIQEGGDVSELKRWKLYRRSILGFLSAPFIGSNIAGGHSQILDSFARFGIFGAVIPVFFVKLSKVCIQVTKHKNLMVFYAAFFVFALIDTCNAMQIPIIVFYVCPMISDIIVLKKESELVE